MRSSPAPRPRSAGRLRPAKRSLRWPATPSGGQDLLIETPHTGLTAVETLVYSLRLKGYRIILAHPERSVDEDDRAVMIRLVEQGVVLQVNADALVTRRRSAAGRLAAWLCTEGLAHAVASDGHRADSWRPVTVLGEATAALKGLVGEARARWMTTGVPAAIIAGEELPEPAPIAQRRRVPWLR